MFKLAPLCDMISSCLSLLFLCFPSLLAPLLSLGTERAADSQINERGLQHTPSSSPCLPAPVCERASPGMRHAGGALAAESSTCIFGPSALPPRRHSSQRLHICRSVLTQKVSHFLSANRQKKKNAGPGERSLRLAQVVNNNECACRC